MTRRNLLETIIAFRFFLPFGIKIFTFLDLTRRTTPDEMVIPTKYVVAISKQMNVGSYNSAFTPGNRLLFDVRPQIFNIGVFQQRTAYVQRTLPAISSLSDQ